VGESLVGDCAGTLEDGSAGDDPDGGLGPSSAVEPELAVSLGASEPEESLGLSESVGGSC
jgi:hypothetical protein